MSITLDQNNDTLTIAGLLAQTELVDADELAQCRSGHDRDRWFPFTPEDLAYAQSVCQTCPLASACLTAGIDNAEFGVWGGRYLEKGQEVLLPVERRRQKVEASAG